MLNRIRRRLGWSPKIDLMDFWTHRVKEMKAHAVLHVDYSAKDIATITEKHSSLVFPHWKKGLTGDEETLLDFGCGAGRFAKSLMELSNAQYIGLDPIADLIAAAPDGDRMTFQLLTDKNHLPLADESIDLIWIYQVMGGIRDMDISPVIAEFNRVTRKDAKICLVENTSDRDNTDYWHYRSIEQYQELFTFFRLQYRASFEEFSETISIFTGQK